MSEPIRIDCESVADLASAEELGAMATTERHVVLQFASLSENDKSALIARLSAALPDHSVFDSGGCEGRSWVTVMCVVARSRVLERRSEILQAVEKYRRLCVSLVEQYLAGELPREWKTCEHGGHCAFTNRRTGQVVEAPLREWINPHLVDPYFFARFVRSTIGFEAVGELLTDDFHDAARVLDTVEYGPNEFHNPKNVVSGVWRSSRGQDWVQPFTLGVSMAAVCSFFAWGAFSLLTMMMNPAVVGADYWAAIRERAESNPILAGAIVLFGAGAIFGLGLMAVAVVRRR